MIGRLYFVNCDVCRQPSAHGSDTSREARRGAIKRGWKRLDGNSNSPHAMFDICADCIKIGWTVADPDSRGYRRLVRIAKAGRGIR